MNLSIVDEFPGLSVNPGEKKIDKLCWQFIMHLEEKLYLLVIDISQPKIAELLSRIIPCVLREEPYLEAHRFPPVILVSLSFSKKYKIFKIFIKTCQENNFSDCKDISQSGICYFGNLKETSFKSCTTCDRYEIH